MLIRPVGYDGSGLQRPILPGDLAAGGENILNGGLATVGAGTWTAALIANGIIRRTGPVGGYTDTTDSAANIVAALAGNTPLADIVAGSSFRLLFINAVAQALTLAAGTGVVLGTGTTTVAASLWREYLFTILNPTPPVTLQATFGNASKVVTFVLPPNMLGFPLGQAANPQGITITPGMIVIDNTTAGNITATTKVVGITQGQSGITGVTLDTNSGGASATLGDSLTFHPSILLDSLRSGTA
jgi:hypothetical protein